MFVRLRHGNAINFRLDGTGGVWRRRWALGKGVRMKNKRRRFERMNDGTGPVG